MATARANAKSLWALQNDLTLEAIRMLPHKTRSRPHFSSLDDAMAAAAAATTTATSPPASSPGSSSPNGKTPTVAVEQQGQEGGEEEDVRLEPKYPRERWNRGDSQQPLLWAIKLEPADKTFRRALREEEDPLAPDLTTVLVAPEFLTHLRVPASCFVYLQR